MHRLFPVEFIRQCIEIYIKDHGKPPKILVVSNIDMVDYTITCSMQQVKSLLDIAPDLKITTGYYLERGEIDLAMVDINDCDREKLNSIMYDLILNDPYIEEDELADDAFVIMFPEADSDTPDIFNEFAHMWIRMLIDSDPGYRCSCGSGFHKER
jgi:hypothetical protein